MSDSGKKVLVSGCYDLLHAGHIAFFKSASAYGHLIVSLGSDRNIRQLKGSTTYFGQDERLYMVQSIRYVDDAFIASGFGLLDFEPDLDQIRPDIFVVNEDGHSEEKERLFRERGIEYIVLERIPDLALPARSSSDAKRDLRFPYRLCLAGGWIDQPWLSKIQAGSVVVAQIWPSQDFNDRSGLATSSRRVAIEIWGDRLPPGEPLHNARLLFGAENPPGTEYISGSQDHIGLLAPGINRLDYNGSFWPDQVQSCLDPDICDWLSRIIHLVPLKPRPEGYDPLEERDLRRDWVGQLGQAGRLCFESILKRDIYGLGEAMNSTFSMWRKILPHTVPDPIADIWEKFASYPGAVTSGCGGGYMMVVSEEPLEETINIRIKY